MAQRDVFNAEMEDFIGKMTLKRRPKEGNTEGVFFRIRILLILGFNGIMTFTTCYNPIKSQNQQNPNSKKSKILRGLCFLNWAIFKGWHCPF